MFLQSFAVDAQVLLGGGLEVAASCREVGADAVELLVDVLVERELLRDVKAGQPVVDHEHVVCVGGLEPKPVEEASRDLGGATVPVAVCQHEVEVVRLKGHGAQETLDQGRKVVTVDGTHDPDRVGLKRLRAFAHELRDAFRLIVCGLRDAPCRVQAVARPREEENHDVPLSSDALRAGV